jgi:hypothetical protein
MHTCFHIMNLCFLYPESRITELYYKLHCLVTTKFAKWFPWNFQGRAIPCDFIGIVRSQQPVYLKGIYYQSCWFFFFSLMACWKSYCHALIFSMWCLIHFILGEVVSNHDELMSNFFAQPDALAYGKVSLYSLLSWTYHIKYSREWSVLNYHLPPHPPNQPKGNRRKYAVLFFL